MWTISNIKVYNLYKLLSAKHKPPEVVDICSLFASYAVNLSAPTTSEAQNENFLMRVGNHIYIYFLS